MDTKEPGHPQVGLVKNFMGVAGSRELTCLVRWRVWPQFAILRQVAAVEYVESVDRDIILFVGTSVAIPVFLTHPWPAWRSLIQKDIKL
jgi:hypothetical protein